MKKFNIKEWQDKYLVEAKTKQIPDLKVGDKFIVNIEPGILSAQRAYYKLSPKKFGNIVFQVAKVNPKSITAIDIKTSRGRDSRLPYSAFPATGGYYADKKGNRVEEKDFEAGKGFRRFVFTTQWTQKGDGNIPVTLK
mgnify:CR=1 FL=1